MKFLLPLSLLSLVRSWEVDDRCLTRRHLKRQQHLGDLFEIEDLAEKDVDKQHHTQDDGTQLLLTERKLQSDGDGLRFNLKLHWEEGNCWQEEWRERRWCMECAGSTCNEEDILEIQVCENTNRQEFTWMPAEGGGRLKVSNKNLCLERISLNFFKLKTCSATIKQILIGFNPNEPFELHPSGDSDKCLNQHHHPKAFEEIHTTSCSLARLYQTNQWEVEWVKGTPDSNIVDDPAPTDSKELRARTSECSRANKCDECEGDCDSNNQCKGNLKCYHRRGDNPWDEIPGCTGRGAKQWDYCYDPDEEALEKDSLFASILPTKNPSGEYTSSGAGVDGRGDISLVRPVRDCSSIDQCDECEGDCDTDSHCKGTLVCFQKDGGYLPIPGCSGRDLSKTDWCIDPNKIVT